MTRDEILAIQPGPELDDELAIKILGWQWRSRAWFLPTDNPTIRERRVYRFLVGPNGESPMTFSIGEVCELSMKHDILPRSIVPCYSSTWDAMRLVVEAMAAKGWRCDINIGNSEKGHHALFWKPGLIESRLAVDSDTAPHAVAIAALLALEGEDS